MKNYTSHTTKKHGVPRQSPISHSLCTTKAYMDLVSASKKKTPERLKSKKQKKFKRKKKLRNDREIRIIIR